MPRESFNAVQCKITKEFAEKIISRKPIFRHTEFNITSDANPESFEKEIQKIADKIQNESNLSTFPLKIKGKIYTKRVVGFKLPIFSKPSSQPTLSAPPSVHRSGRPIAQVVIEDNKFKSTFKVTVIFKFDCLGTEEKVNTMMNEGSGLLLDQRVSTRAPPFLCGFCPDAFATRYPLA